MGGKEKIPGGPEWYRLLFESNPQPVMIIDPASLKILDANKAAMSCCGAGPKDTGKDFPAADFKQLGFDTQLLEIVSGDEEVTGFACSHRGKDDGVADLEITIRNIEFAGERGPGRARLLLLNDVTRGKSIEYELLKARKLESVGLLAGGIAHDFNNLLTAILGNISLAKMNLPPGGGKLYERLADAERASLKAKDLTYQLLTFSKGGEPCKEKLLLPEVLRDAAAQTLAGSPVSAEFRFCQDLWPVEADRAQMKIVLQNVIANAREAMPAGGRITLEADNFRTAGGHSPLPLVKNGRYVRIKVADRGRGIPPENLERIFDPYFTTKKMGSLKGMGMGLAIVYSIISKHNGFVGVESEPGEGTTFYIYLPALEGEIPRTDSKTGAGRVLVVDDEEMVREVAGEMLMNLDYEVAYAADGNSAVEIYRSASQSGNPFDAVVLDLTMPGGGGPQVIKRLLELDPRVRAIASRGYPDDPVMRDFRKYGYMESIAKPYRLEDLNRKLHSVLER